jgi:hypothetical protein
MDGEITFLVGEEIKTARTGDYVMVPRNTRQARNSLDGGDELPNQMQYEFST